MEIDLSNGKVTLIDEEDRLMVERLQLSISNGYVEHRKVTNGVSVREKLHRMILWSPKGMLIDHINGDTLDNRKANLRICDKSLNGANRGKNRNNSSGFKGVTKHGRKWVAQMKVGKVHRYLGIFDTKEEASNAYSDAASRAFGAFAKV